MIEIYQETDTQYDIILDYAELTDNLNINVQITNLQVPAFTNKLIEWGLSFINKQIDPININIVFG